MLMAPPNGDQADRPVSSYSTIRTLGAPSGALRSVNGSQSGFESRTSSLITPLNGFFAMLALLDYEMMSASLGHIPLTDNHEMPRVNNGNIVDAAEKRPFGRDRVLIEQKTYQPL